MNLMVISKNYLNSISIIVLLYYFVIYIMIQSFNTQKEQSLLSIIVLILSFSILIISLSNYFKKNYKHFIWFFFLITYMIIYLIYYHFYRMEYITDAGIWFQFKVILYSVFNIMLGVIFYKNINKKYFYVLMYISFFILVWFILLNIDYNLLKYKLRHQLIGAVLPIIGLYIVFLIEKKYLKILIMTFILLLLFIIKSRASFYSFFIVYLIFLIKEIGFKNFFYLFLFFIIFFLLLYSFDIIRIDTRMFGFTVIRKDSSFSERMEQFKYGLDAIKNNYFFGQYLGQTIIHSDSVYKSGLGSYMHNWLSFLRQFGIIFFMVFTIFYFSRLIKVYKPWKKHNKNSDFIFYLGFYMFINILLFHSYTYSYIWFVLTVMHLYVIDEQRTNDKN